MVEELKSMGMELMVSIWPHGVDQAAKTIKRCWRTAIIARCDQGIAAA